MHQVKITFFIIILFSSLHVQAQQALFTGKVYDKHNMPICGAHIKVLEKEAYAISNINGIFSLSDTMGAVIKIAITYTGYEPLFKTVKFANNKKVRDFKMVASNVNLDEVVITGTGTHYRIDKAPVQTEIITQKDIAELSGRNVEEIISNVSSSISYTSSSMGSNIKINGLGKDYVLILVNGKRLTGGAGGYADLSRINSEDIEQIEVVKGASSTLYGSDAIAGVINIITKKNKHNFAVSNSSRLGEYGEIKQLNSISFNKNKLSSKTTLNYKQKEGYQLNNMRYNNQWEKNHDLPYLESTHYKPVNKSRAYTISQYLGYEVNDKLSLTSDLSWYEKRLFFPFKAQMHDYYYNNKSASIGGEYKINKTDIISFGVDYNNYKYYTEYPYKYNETYITSDDAISVTYYPGENFKNSDQTTTNAQIKGVFSLPQNNRLSIGAEVMGEYLEAQYRLTKPNVQAYMYSTFVQDELEINEKLNLVAGLRAIYHNKAGFNITPKVTLMHKETRCTNRLTYSNGFKAPTLKETYYYYESERMGIYRLYLGNENLKPQQSHYLSYSSEFKISKFRTGINFYVNRITNKIDYQIDETSYEHRLKGIEETKKRYNIDDAQSLGVDWHFRYNIVSGMAINGGYSYVDAVNLTQNIRLNGVSAHSATLKLTYTKGWKPYKLNITVAGVYKSDRFYLEEDLERSYAKPYQLLKMTTNHTFYKVKRCDITAIAGIDNVLDFVDNSPYGGYYGTLNPGRTFFMGLNINFSKQN